MNHSFELIIEWMDAAFPIQGTNDSSDVVALLFRGFVFVVLFKIGLVCLFSILFVVAFVFDGLVFYVCVCWGFCIRKIKEWWAASKKYKMATLAVAVVMYAITVWTITHYDRRHYRCSSRCVHRSLKYWGKCFDRCNHKYPFL